MPIVFLCEDNGIGISTRTPKGWIAQGVAARPGWRYVAGDGTDLVDAYRAARDAVDFARAQRRPVFLHLSMVRLYGHAGADLQSAYRTGAEIAEDEARDPLLATAALLVEEGVLTPSEVRDEYDAIEADLASRAEEAIARPKLADAAAVMASIVPPPREPTLRQPAPGEREALFASDAALMAQPQHMARLLSWALADILLERPHAIVCGEDVGLKGGVYNVTAKLHQRFGRARVIDTLLDEQSILGLAIGAAHNGTNCAASRRRCRSSAVASSPTRWSCGSPGCRTRRALAGTSTTTTASPSSATYPG
jgi:2-oxoisovalerate dehydrogenase E1 component